MINILILEINKDDNIQTNQRVSSVRTFHPANVAIEILKIHNELIETHPDLKLFVDEFLKGLVKLDSLEMRFERTSTIYDVKIN